MNRHYIIAIIFVISACSSDRKEVILREYLNSYNQSIETINKANKIIYDDFENKMSNILGNPEGVKPWYEKATYLKQNSNRIISNIDSLKITLENIVESEPKKQVKLSKSEIALLKIEFEEFEDLLISALGEDSIVYKSLIESIKDNLNVDNWNQLMCLSGNKSTLIETLAVLTKLQANVKMAESGLLRYLYSNLSGACRFHLHKSMQVIEPNSQIIPQGNNYSANIFFGLTDTTIVPSFFIEGESVDVLFGKAIYKERVSSKDTLVKRSGYVLIRNGIGFPIKVPFQVEYEVRNLN